MVNPRYASHILGTGPITIELWLDYICPFSAKAFHNVYKTVVPAVEKKYPGKVQWVFQHQLQPWHPQGGWLHEYAIAVGLVNPNKFWEFSEALFDKSKDFYDEQTVDKTRTQIEAELSAIAKQVGVDVDAVAEAVKITPGEPRNAGTKVTNDVKWFVKVSRQNGIHVSPTVLVDGLEDSEISSSWTESQWLEKIDKISEAIVAKI